MMQTCQRYSNSSAGHLSDLDTAETRHCNSVDIGGHNSDLDATVVDHESNIDVVEDNDQNIPGISRRKSDFDSTIVIGHSQQKNFDVTTICHGHLPDVVAHDVHQTDFDIPEINHQKCLDTDGHICRKDVDTEDGYYQEQGQGGQKYWYVTAVISCFIANLVFGGVGNSYGVLYIYMKDSLGVSEYQLSWLGSLMNGFCGMASIVATVLVETVGCRITTLIGGLVLSASLVVSSQTSNLYILYLTLGVLPGVGTTFSYLATLVHISRMFSKWLPLVTGISVTGTAIGILIWPPMISGIADIMGWRGTVLIHGAILLHLVPAALMIQTDRKKVARDTGSKFSLCQSLTNYFRTFKLPGALNLIIVAPVFVGLSYYSFTSFVPQYAIATLPDMTSSDASLIISAVGVGNVISRLLVSIITMVLRDSPLPIYMFALFASGIVDIAVTLCCTSGAFLASGVFYGLAAGAWTGVYSLAIVKQFGVKYFPMMMGTFLVTEGFGSTSGPPLLRRRSHKKRVHGGPVSKQTSPCKLRYIGSVTKPENMFYTAGVFYFISVLAMLPLIFNKKKFVPGRRKSVTLKVFTLA